MNKIIKNTLILTVITLVAGLGLGFVYEITKEPIAQAQEAAKKEAWQAVFPEADLDEFEPVDVDQKAADKVIKDLGIKGSIDEVCTVGEDGYVITTTDSEGYGGDIKITVGITADGTVNGVSILSISETAGLGMKAKDDPSWGKQFAGKKVESFSVVKDGSGSGDDAKIDAISGATITSKAVTGAMNSCLAYFQSLEGGN